MSPLLELGLSLPRRGSRRRLGALDQLRTAILAGRLHPGLRLPSSRTLAADCGMLSRATVVATYERLLGEGYLVARTGAGTFVAHGLPAHAAPARLAPASGADLRLTARWRGVGHTPPPAAGRGPHYDFRVGVPDAATFPADLWRRLLGRAVRAAGPAGTGYAAAAGREALRAGIAEPRLVHARRRLPRRRTSWSPPAPSRPSTCSRRC